MNRFLIKLTVLSIILCVNAYSQNYSDPGSDIEISTNYEHGFNTDIDDGGEISFDRFSIEGSLGRKLNRKTDISVSSSYSYTKFDFSGADGFASLDPWNEINKVSLGLRTNYLLNNNWSVAGGTFIRFAGEDGADFSDSLRYGGFAGVTYIANRNFMIGTGLFITSRFEDNVGVYPGLVLNWNIDEKTKLSSLITGVKSELGPRLQLSRLIGQRIKTSVSVGYEFNSFRLDDEGVAPGGIGDVKVLPVWASLEYEISETVSVEIYSGLGFLGQLELEDSDGDEIADEDFDTMYFLGGGFKVKL